MCISDLQYAASEQYAETGNRAHGSYIKFINITWIEDAGTVCFQPNLNTSALLSPKMNPYFAPYFCANKRKIASYLK